MAQFNRMYWSNVAAIVVAVALAVVFTGSVLGAEGRLPQRLMPEVVSVAVTTSVTMLPGTRSHR